MACNPYEPGFAACSGIPETPRLNPYGPGLPTPPPLSPFAPLVVEIPQPSFAASVEDELALEAGPRPVPEPAPVLLVGLALALMTRRWRSR